MIEAKVIAQYFLFICEKGDITNLKLQKLLYYAQGFHIALYNKPLFPEQIEAWTHGPVVPEVYHEYKQYGAQPIPRPLNVEISLINQDVRILLKEIYENFGLFSAWALRNLTHKERPWLTTPNGDEISHSILREYFLTRIQP